MGVQDAAEEGIVGWRLACMLEANVEYFMCIQREISFEERNGLNIRQQYVETLLFVF